MIVRNVSRRLFRSNALENDGIGYSNIDCALTEDLCKNNVYVFLPYTNLAVFFHA